MTIIQQHYEANFDRLVKTYSFRSGTQWDAEDIVQEAYANALKYFHSFDGTDFNKWFSGIIRNTFKDYMRKAQGFSTEEFEEEEFFADNLPSEMNDEITKMIDAKKGDSYVVLKHWFVDDLKPKDIALVTGITPVNCRVIIKRFRDDLKLVYS